MHEQISEIDESAIKFNQPILENQETPCPYLEERDKETSRFSNVTVKDPGFSFFQQLLSSFQYLESISSDNEDDDT